MTIKGVWDLSEHVFELYAKQLFDSCPTSVFETHQKHVVEIDPTNVAGIYPKMSIER